MLTYESEYTLSIGDLEITTSVELYFGSVSGAVAWDFNSASFSIAPPMRGAGYKFGVDLDWK